jgi:hypothetical protein
VGASSLVAATARTLTDTITTGGLPGTPDNPASATPGKTITVSADPTRDYVAGGVGGSGQWFTNYAKSLPPDIDELARDFGVDIYERMASDPQVAAALLILKASILEDGAKLAPALDDETDPDYALAVQLNDLATAMLEALETPLDEVLWNLLDAVSRGNEVAEQVYAYQAHGGATRLMLTALRVKPRLATAFVVDAYGRLLGLLARIPGEATPVQTGYIDPTSLPNFMPRAKFAILSFRPEEGSPVGTSVLRSAYTAWFLKRQVMQEHLRYLTQFAAPSVVATTGLDAQDYVPTDALGNPTGPFDTNGLPIPITPEQRLLDTLAGFKNGTALALPNGTTFQIFFSSGTGEAFIHAFDLYDRMITKSILGQTLASEEGRHQSRAASLVHQDVLDTIIKQAKRAVARMLARDILMPWIRYNWGEDAVRLCPRVTLGTTEQSDIVQMMNGIAALQTSGYIAASQYTGLDEALNFSPRLPEEVALMQRTAELAAQPKPAPVIAPPGTVPGAGTPAETGTGAAADGGAR